jgi:hypothetical protein
LLPAPCKRTPADKKTTRPHMVRRVEIHDDCRSGSRFSIHFSRLTKRYNRVAACR